MKKMRRLAAIGAATVLAAARKAAEAMEQA